MHKVDHRCLILSGSDAFPHQAAQIPRQLRIAVFNGLVLADQAAQFAPDLPRQRFLGGVGQPFIRIAHGAPGGQRKQQAEENPARHAYLRKRGRNSFSSVSAVMGPAQRQRIMPWRSSK